MFLLLLPEILGAFLNTLTGKGKYLIEDFATPNSNAIIWKTQNIF